MKNKNIKSYHDIYSAPCQGVGRVNKEPVLPVVDRLSVLCELKFQAELRQNDTSLFLDVVVDTGAGFGYLLWPDSLPWTWESRQVDMKVAMANGQVSPIDKILNASLRVGHQDYAIELRVLGTSNPMPSILCGRHLIQQFGLTICGSSRLLSREGLCLFDSVPASCPNTVGVDQTVLPDFGNDTAALVLEGFSDMARPTEVDEDSVIPPKEHCDSKLADAILSQVASSGDMPMLYCPSATLKLEEIKPVDCDLPDQTHQFRLSLTLPASLANRKSYSYSLYCRLPVQQKNQFDELVSEYVKAGWWSRIQPKELKDICPADVFLHKGGTSKARLVCDFRPFNALFKDVSSTVPLIDHLLLLLRTESLPYVFLGDCSKAFYRVALSPPLPLRAGPNVFMCSRVSFGLSMGPETLRCSLGLLMNAWRAAVSPSERGFLSVYIDDFQLLCNCPNLPWSLLHLLRRCGFAVSKKKFQMGFPLKVFGTVLDRNPRSDGVVSVAAMSPPLENLASIVDQVKKAPTKRLVFELAGRVGYDPLKTAPTLRLIADLTRSLAGRSRVKWDSPLQFPNTESQKMFEELISWLGNAAEERQSQIYYTETGHQLPNLTLSTDASIFGYGYTVEFNKHLVQQSAHAWKASQFSYHSNRLEGLALLTGMRTVAKFLEFRKSVAFGSFPTPSIEVRSDSKSALAWAHGRPPTDVKGLEYRMIIRLQAALTEELTVLKSLSSACAATHLPGEENPADALSRLLYRTVSGKTMGSILRGSPIEKVLLLESPDHSFEALARTSLNYEHLLEKVEFALQIFRSWSQRGIVQAPVEEVLVKSLQTMMTPQQRARYVDIDGMFHHQWTDYNGNLYSKPVLPVQAEATRFLIARHLHKLNGHRGSKYDTAALFEQSTFFVENPINLCRNVIRRCLICAMNKSRVSQPVPAYTYPRSLLEPAFTRIAIDVTYAGRKRPVFSSMCLDTGVVFFHAIPDATRASILEGLSVLSDRYCVRFKLIRSDNAPALNESLNSVLRRGGHPDVVFSKTPVAGSVSNPVERMHEELWRLVRARGFLKKAVVQDDFNRQLEKVCKIINNRPLGWHLDGSDEIVITPAKLAFGHAYGKDGEALAEFRRLFYENYFLIFRRRHNPVARRMRLSVGDFVLLRSQAGDKTELPFVIARILTIGRGMLTVRTGGKTLDVVTTAVAPLDRYFFADGDVEAPDDSPGGHVEISASSD